MQLKKIAVRFWQIFPKETTRIIGIINQAAFFVIFLFVICARSTATEVVYLSLNESVNRALLHNESIIAVKQDVKAAQSRLKEAILNWLPNFNFSIDSHYYKKLQHQESGLTDEVEIIPGIKIPSTFLASRGNKFYDTDIALSVNQLLFDSGKISSQIAKAKNELEFSKLNLSKSESNITFQVIEDYYKLFELNKYISLLKKQCLLAKYSLNLTEKKYQSGEIGDLEIAEKQINVTEAEYKLSLALEEKFNKRNDLLQLLNLSHETDFILEMSVPFITDEFTDLTRITEETKRNNPDILEAELTLKLKENNITLSRSEQNPTARLYGKANYFKTGNTLNESWEKFNRAWVAGLIFDWPFFDSGKNWNKVSASVSDFKKAEIDLNYVVASAVLEVERLYKKLKNTKRKMKINSEKKDLTEKKLQISRQLYSRGRITDGNLLAKEIALEEAKINELKAIIDVEIIKADLQRKTGRRQE